VTPWLLEPAFIVCPPERLRPLVERDVPVPEQPEVERALREEVGSEESIELVSSIPAIAISWLDPVEPRSSDQSLIWSLKRLICSLI
jgi:hypothetical protein